MGCHGAARITALSVLLAMMTGMTENGEAYRPEQPLTSFWRSEASTGAASGSIEGQGTVLGSIRGPWWHLGRLFGFKTQSVKGLADGARMSDAKQPFSESSWHTRTENSVAQPGKGLAGGAQASAILPKAKSNRDKMKLPSETSWQLEAPEEESIGPLERGRWRTRNQGLGYKSDGDSNLSYPEGTARRMIKVEASSNNPPERTSANSGDSLPETAKRVATKEGVIIVTTTTNAMLHFLDNWFAFLTDVGLGRHCLVFSYDAQSHDFVNARWPGQSVRVQTEGPGKSGTERGKGEGGEGDGGRPDEMLQFGSATFLNLMSGRAAVILAVLRLGFSCLFSDTDIVYLRDPLPWLLNTTTATTTPTTPTPTPTPPSSSFFPLSPSRYSIFFQMDNYEEWQTPEEWTHIAPLFPAYNKPQGPVICTGIMFFRPSPHAIALVEMFEDSLQEGARRGWGDQSAMNGAVQGVVRRVKEGKAQGNDSRIAAEMAMLPQGYFSPGWQSIRMVKPENKDAEEWKGVVSLHFNFLKYKREKQLLMYEAKLWRSALGTPPGDLIQLNVTLNTNGSIAALNTSALRAIAQPRARNGTVLVTMVSENIQEVESFLQGLRVSHSAPNSVAFVENELVFQQVNEQQHGMPVLLMPNKDSAASPEGGATKHFLHALIPSLLLHLLEAGLSVCYTDTRFLWLRWPFPIDAHYDILLRNPDIQNPNCSLPEDYEVTSAVTDEKVLREASPDWFCLPQSAASRRFLKLWDEAAAAERERGEAEGAHRRAFPIALRQWGAERVRTLSHWSMPLKVCEEWEKKNAETLKSRVLLLDSHRWHLGYKDVDNMMKSAQAS